VGIELPCAQATYGQALSRAIDLPACKPDDWEIEVADEAGATVMTLLLFGEPAGSLEFAVQAGAEQT
jgi:hypothetical protein